MIFVGMFLHVNSIPGPGFWVLVRVVVVGHQVGFICSVAAVGSRGVQAAGEARLSSDRCRCP